MTQVLVVARDPGIREQLSQAARQCGLSTEALEDFEPAYAALEKEPPALLVIQDPPDDDVMERLEKTLRAHAPVTPLLVYLGERDGARALKRMAQGAYDCLCPPLTPKDFLAAGKRAASRLGRRLLTTRRVGPVSWWRQPVTYVAVGVVAFVSLLAMGLVGLWTPPFQIYQLASDHPVAVAAEKDAVWVVDWSQQNLTCLKVLGDYLSIVRVHKLADFQPVALAIAPYYAYTASADGRLRRHRWDDTLGVVASVPAPGPSPSGLAWDGQTLWSCDSYTGQIYEHDARLGVKAAHPSPTTKPVGLAWEDGSLWVADGERNALWKLTRKGTEWDRQGPLALEAFAHNRRLQLSGFTLWHKRAWIVSEAGGVLLQHRLPEGGS